MCTHTFLSKTNVNAHTFPNMEYILLRFYVFLFLEQDKLKELGIPCDVSSVISDIELNILKSVDDILGGGY